VGAVRDLLGDPGAEPQTLVHAPQLIERVRASLTAHNRTHSGSSMRIARVLLLAEPPSLDADEITDKGYVNQRAARERRSAEVAALYAEPPPPEVITCP
jgi:feruloyl-CoA synthase